MKADPCEEDFFLQHSPTSYLSRLGYGRDLKELYLYILLTGIFPSCINIFKINGFRATLLKFHGSSDKPSLYEYTFVEAETSVLR